MDDALPLNDFKAQDGKKIALQILEFQENNKEKDEIIVAVRKFSPQTWELGKVFEVKINSKASLHSFGEKLCTVFGILEENIEIYKIINNNFNRGEIKNSKFERLKGKNEKLSGYPYFINEGSIIM